VGITALNTLGVNFSERKKIDQLIEKTREEIYRKKKREKSVLNNLTGQQQQLNTLEDNYEQVKDHLGVVQNKVALTKNQLRLLQQNLGGLEQELASRQELLNKRMVVTYKYGPQTYLEALFSAKNFADMVYRFETISYFIKNDLNLIKELENSKIRVTEQHELVKQKKRQVEIEYHQVVSIRDEVSKQQQMVNYQMVVTKKELQKIQNDREKLEKALEEYEQTSREIEAEIRRLEKRNPGVVYGSGNMMWPLRGRIASTFGWRVHPILRYKKYHNGLDIAVPSGTNVKAVDHGIVVVCGWQGGYGNYIAIKHGNGISSCYGHNSKLLVKNGQRVSKGQVIARAGSTGLSTGPHLHFEIRRNGVPVNPMPYLP